MITINITLFVFICVFACIGVLIFLLGFIYFLCAILDLTYYERHKNDEIRKAKQCPDFIEKE